MTNAPDKGAWWWIFAAWLFSLAATGGVLFVGEVIGQKPCVLCWYQRVFMFPLPILLGVGCYLSDPKVWRYTGPLAAAGGLIAVYHTLLYFGVLSEGIQPCEIEVPCTGDDMTLFGVFPLPVLSVAAFGAICLSLVLSGVKSKQ